MKVTSVAKDAYFDARRAHAHCMVCGETEQNPGSLGLKFVRKTDGGVAASIRLDSRRQGYRGILHGGMISTLLDAAMTHCLFARGIRALTVELSVRFVAPIETGVQVSLTARLLRQVRRTYYLEASMTRGSLLLARGTAKFIDPRAKGGAKLPPEI